MEKMPGKGIIAICCVLAIALAALSAWDGVKQLDAAVTMHMSEQMVDVAGYASAYTARISRVCWAPWKAWRWRRRRAARRWTRRRLSG